VVGETLEVAVAPATPIKPPLGDSAVVVAVLVAFVWMEIALLLRTEPSRRALVEPFALAVASLTPTPANPTEKVLAVAVALLVSVEASMTAPVALSLAPAPT